MPWLCGVSALRYIGVLYLAPVASQSHASPGRSINAPPFERTCPIRLSISKPARPRLATPQRIQGRWYRCLLSCSHAGFPGGCRCCFESGGTSGHNLDITITFASVTSQDRNPSSPEAHSSPVHANNTTCSRQPCSGILRKQLWGKGATCPPARSHKSRRWALDP